MGRLGDRTQSGGIVDTVWSAVRRRCEVDLRALAAFRITLGALLIADLVLRSRNLVAFYTDEGVLPRDALFSDYSGVYSLHVVSGEAWVQVGLFLFAGLVAFALLVGYRTRIATVGSWLLLLSLHARNPMVLNGGDVLLRMLLFWGMFLPLGRRWALDASGDSAERSSVASVATAALLLQMVLLYVTNAAHKLQGEKWLGGEAISYVFSLDQFTVLLGDALAGYHGLLSFLTYVWVALILLSPLLVLSTGLPRMVLASLIGGMHLGMLVTMQLGLFPLVVVAGLLPFYPPVVWDIVTDIASRVGIIEYGARSREWIHTHTPDRLAPGRVLLAVPSSAHRRSALASALARGRTIFGQAIPLFFLVLIVLSNAQSVGVASVPDEGRSVLETTETDQSWRMFAPDPLAIDGWYVAPGELANGTEVDVLTGNAVDWQRPRNIDKTYPTARWRKYLGNVWSSSNHNHRSYFAHYLCYRWNSSHETDVQTVAVYYMAQESQPFEETEPIEKLYLHGHDCRGDLRQ